MEHGAGSLAPFLMNFCHVICQRRPDMEKEAIPISGLYLWHKVFEGDFALFDDVRDGLNGYDVLLVAIGKQELDSRIISRCREIVGENTKIVACMDYGVEIWSNLNLWYLEIELRQADHIFVSEGHAKIALQALFGDDTEIHQIPHPTDIDNVATAKAFDGERPREILMALLHSFENNWTSLFLALKGLNKPIMTYLPGETWDNELHSYFQKCHGKVTHTKFLRHHLSHAFVVVDSYHWMHNYGRLQVEAAVLGVPVVGSSVTYAQEFLWPALTAEPGDVITQRRMINRLYEDPAFYQECVGYAADRVEQFGYEARRKAFMKMITDKSAMSLKVNGEQDVRDDETEVRSETRRTADVP